MIRRYCNELLIFLKGYNNQIMNGMINIKKTEIRNQ